MADKMSGARNVQEELKISWNATKQESSWRLLISDKRAPVTARISYDSNICEFMRTITARS